MTNTWVVVDVEADGKVPPRHSMVSFGAVIMEAGLARSFYGETAPISDLWQPEALVVSGKTRDQHLAMPLAQETMGQFTTWLAANCVGRPIFVSDNPAFDWQWINWYFEEFTGSNPFGHSARRIGDLYAGFMRDVTKSSHFKRLRTTKHTHHPVDDARGNVEALLAMQAMGLRFPS